ncbi:DUF3575 domain-containing protein [Niabella hibiscisoli]|uniref:DUF3575 domain-containing protein n=1 Tax=Niabella hibiscisoli TaxID=1825928 RepID=UPI001F0EB490|nr:DUF3575 domain-containing protein [Niabella hibiscisoli]MCH5715867.1 DUF3575 domain-containing protein [Niabella hibiscisoli]
MQVKSNLVKFNLTAPILKNYALQYERVLNKRISVALSGRIMPASTIPLKRLIRDEVIRDDNELVTDILNQVQFSNFAITPELRIYLGRKGYGQGFYIAPYYRFAKYKMHEATLSYEADQTYSVRVSGDLTGHTGGLLLGSQWNLGKSLSLDLWIAGPGIGGANGHIIGVANQTLPAEAQDELRTYLQDINVPFATEKVSVNANGARMDLTGSWAGIRTGILLAFRF